MPSDLPSHLRARSSHGGYRYLFSQPSNPKTTPRGWPLIIFLHGAGQRGSQLPEVLKHGLPRLLSGAAELSPAEHELGRELAQRFIIVAPQCDIFEVWEETPVLRLLDDVLGTLGVDPARVYLTGLSMGGFGVWSIGLRNPHRFAALVPVCGGGRISDVTTARRARPLELSTLGVWAFHGARDRIVPLEESVRMVAALREAGRKDVTLTIYPEAEHDSWTPAYSDPELYRWLLRHRKSNTPL